MNVIEGHLSAADARWAIVVSRWNSFITERLVEGAEDTLVRHGASADDITLVRVPGSFELPAVVRRLAASDDYDGIIVIGCVIRGATPHFDYISSDVTKGIGQIAMNAEAAVSFGVLTTDTIDQAIERAGTKAGNKGVEAATACIEMVDLFRRLAADA